MDWAEGMTSMKISSSPAQGKSPIVLEEEISCDGNTGPSESSSPVTNANNKEVTAGEQDGPDGENTDHSSSPQSSENNKEAVFEPPKDDANEEEESYLLAEYNMMTASLKLAGLEEEDFTDHAVLVMVSRALLPLAFEEAENSPD
uniref:Uncharacterized protein n=1 Tax=Coccidioides posadasii RMSCC 3488 TaxID=454284 RepID=A0A0J6INH1_COCPO|nr:hypothetical protein CPAG_09751 [Coccidioides posadasii RMSCC 3488]